MNYLEEKIKSANDRIIELQLLIEHWQKQLDEKTTK
jgi:hypothetical protein